MGFAPITDNQLPIYKKMLSDSEASRRVEAHWTNVFMALTVLFGSAFFVAVLLWASKVI
jgi:hypothetical protein